MTAQVYGLMGILDIRLSAVPAVVIITCLGIGTGFFIPLVATFSKTDGKSKGVRMMIALDSISPALIHGVVCFLMLTGMLFFSEFDFIVK
jgi:predicted RND superfamily exporter protein